MENENVPQWLSTILVVIAALGGKELLSYVVKNRGESRKENRRREHEVEDSNRELSNQVLLEMIEGLKSDINEQKSIEQVLRSSLMKEMAEKVRFQTQLEMLLKQLESDNEQVQDGKNAD